MENKKMEDKKSILVVSFQSLTASNAAGMARLGYYVSEELNKRGLLKTFVVHSKGKFRTSFPSIPVSFLSRYYLFFLNKLDKIFHFKPNVFRFVQEVLYDWFCSRRISDQVSILLTTQAHMKRSFKKARKLGINIIYIPANPEDNYIYDLVTAEKYKLNIKSIDSYTYQPRLNFYNESMQYVDTVIGTYPTVYSTYCQAKIKSEVVQINGHLKPSFKAAPFRSEVPSGVFRVGYLAHTVVLKGLQYLLEAWKQLIREMPEARLELYIGGAIDKSLMDYINKRYRDIPGVHYLGNIPDVPTFMQKIELFVVPSLVDGGPYTALEAAHYGVPVIITENCGSGELLSRKESGCWIIPIKDADSIKERLKWAYNNREEVLKIGANAKINLDNYKMDEVIQGVADFLEGKLKDTLLAASIKPTVLSVNRPVMSASR